MKHTTLITIVEKLDGSFLKAMVSEVVAGTISLSNCTEDGFEHIVLIQSADVDESYKRKGVYTTLINKAIENLKEGEKLLSMGRSNDATMFWSDRLNIDASKLELGIEKDQQEVGILIDKYGFELINIEDYQYLDFE